MQWHAVPLGSVYKELQTSPQGLSSSEAAARLARLGPNELKRVGGVSPLTLFAEQFKNVLVLLLLGAAIVSAAIGETLDAIAITVILVLNAILGFVQEYKAERALAALQQLVKATCTVVRDGK